MVTVMMEIHRLKNYREETLYLALSIADRFLAKLLENGESSPCLIHLAFVSILMAAKLEEPIQPSFKRMATLAKNEWEFDTKVHDLIALEARIIRTLDWNLLYAGPLFFLERFLRLFGLDMTKD